MPSQPRHAAGQISISATFTAEPLQETLSFWQQELGWNDEIAFAPYNQLFQTLLDPSSLFARNRHGVNVALVRIEDLGDSAADLARAIRQHLSHTQTPLLLVFTLPSPAAHSHSGAREEALLAELQTVTGLLAVPSRQLQTWYPVPAFYDPTGEELGHVPYTPAAFAALGTAITRVIHSLRSAPYKAIVLDCDNTLWQGACGEEGPADVLITPAHRYLQEFMTAQRDYGRLLCLCSKNNEEDVRETFRVHPEMPLQWEHLTAWRINWESKGPNLASLARELNIGLDTLIFLDDDAKECAEAALSCPAALTLPLPHDPAGIPQFLQHVWAFDALRATAEDRQRAALYAQEAERTQLAAQSSSLEEFLAALELQVHIAPVTTEQLARAAQLTQRTNQMNTTTLRRSEAELAALLRNHERDCLIVDVTDRFGSYGLVGLMLFTTAEQHLLVDSFLLSCRALGRGVEHRMLAHAAHIAQQRGLQQVVVPFRETAKNLPARQFLDSLSEDRHENGYTFQTAALINLTYRPASPPQAPMDAPASAASPRPATDYYRIARELHTAQAILDEVHAAQLARATPPAAPAAIPRTPVESQLAQIWAELLHVPTVGIHDDFFDLGGHSLLAVRLLSRVRQELHTDLSLDIVYTGALTIAEMAKAIELQQLGQNLDPGEYAALLAELESLTDEEAAALLAQEENNG